MADNYLERKMEEMRRGGAGKAVSMRRDASVSWRFPARRVAVAGFDAGLGDALCRAFSRAGCRVAVLGETSGFESGPRMYEAEPSDSAAVSGALCDMAEAWRGVDIVVCRGEWLHAIAGPWLKLREEAPEIADYGRLIVVVEKGASTEISDETAVRLSRQAVTTGFVELSDIKDEETQSDVARVCLFLSLPVNGGLGGCRIVMPSR